MRIVLCLVTALGLTLSAAAPANAALPYDSAYQFESAFLTLAPGESGQLSVFFQNTGNETWVSGTGAQVDLAVCRADKVTCDVPSEQAAWAVSWLSATRYATHAKTSVATGEMSAFTYQVRAPQGIANGTYRFSGDL